MIKINFYDKESLADFIFTSLPKTIESQNGNQANAFTSKKAMVEVSHILADKISERFKKRNTYKPDLNDIINYLNKRFKFNIVNKIKTQQYLFARYVYYRCARDLTNCSLQMIASEMNQHHSNAINALKQYDWYVSKLSYYHNIYLDCLEYFYCDDLSR